MPHLLTTWLEGLPPYNNAQEGGYYFEKLNQLINDNGRHVGSGT